MWDIFAIMGVTCALCAVGLSLIMTSHGQGAAIMSVFTVAALVGLFALDGRPGMLLAFGAGAGVFGCAAAIGTFRFWHGGTPLARAGLTLAILAGLAATLGLAAYLAIPR
ncbi:hypothetical protein [Jannaschia sp. CCS1]|uniref:hypothetical protein n=1 Tax=Jannaschia sp. (strain CCS1) TaxID=290400 RepID=UPI000053BBE9|nr:hypothetical protein [Jannaschia sp. CCS1]ABD53609.1 hypothetical protein Jann_0692 [Jannaschia sp. CCS1]